ncbi:FAD-dependent oxidoreductase [Sphingosinicella sp. BN140058]|uniref:FAD-dependent oxidoreductase n=1 Tax=Sphingosinicella sp. BN140058 TaxID=1892855 RepID=UPI0010103A18|nr:FAD-dependent oxidoreductase [Sphingosinicella sp. BN140058]QAY77384.1 pyridine nucleotide-disulfide oxidoreductase [Sphingosinicella sp. BN140058]
MRHIAIIGSGPAGFYSAEGLQKQYGAGVRIDLIDRLPVPYGLIRSGVAPDHQSIKAVSRRYEKVAVAEGVRFVGNVLIGRDVSIDELRDLYDAVVVATGAPADRPLGIPGSDLPGVLGSAAFVGWYNGHPDFASLDPPLDTAAAAAVIGNGNVALDVARILAKTEAEFAGSDIVGHALEALDRSAIRSIHILGRRGPHQIAMTPKELGELGHLEAARPFVDRADLPPEAADAGLEPGLRKSVAHLRAFAEGAPDGDKPKTICFEFFAMPIAIEGDGRAERLIVERTRLTDDGRAVGTGERHAIDCGLIVTCIGYQTPPIEGIPYDPARGRFANDEGVIGDGVYCVGWARRGPTGTIGTNRPDGFEVAEKIFARFGTGDGGKPGGDGLDALLQTRGVTAVPFCDWQRIEAAEAARARSGSPREKFVSIEDMLGSLAPQP